MKYTSCFTKFLKDTNTHLIGLDPGQQLLQLRFFSTLWPPCNNTQELIPRNLKGGIRSLFDPCVNAMGRRPYCPSRMEVSYCTFGFGAIIRRDLRTLSLPRDSPRDNIFACVIWVYKERQPTLNEIIWRLNYENTRRYNNSPPYVTARWPPQRIPPLNFLGWYILQVDKLYLTSRMDVM